MRTLIHKLLTDGHYKFFPPNVWLLATRLPVRAIGKAAKISRRKFAGILMAAALALVGPIEALAWRRGTPQQFGTPNVALNSAASTGDSTLGSNVITNVVDTSGFAVNDQVIVETKLNRGVVGCGGSWPALVYADNAGVAGNTTLPVASFVGALDTGRTWKRVTTGNITMNITNTSTTATITTNSTPNGTFYDKGMMLFGTGIPAGTYIVSYSGSVPTVTIVMSNAATATTTGLAVEMRYYNADYALYYDQKILPLSMVAKVSAKTANTLTLVYPGGSTPYNAGASETGCNIYYDNKPVIQAFATSSSYVFPAGNYRYSGTLLWNGSGGTFLNTSIRGQGKGSGGTALFIPRGCWNGGMSFYQCSGLALSDFAITSNHGDNGFAYHSTTGNDIFNFGFGIRFELSNTCTATNIKMTNFAGWTFHAAYSYRVIFDRCDQVSINADQRYIQWQWEITNCSILPGDSYSVRCVDCSSTNTYLTAALESFSSRGAHFIRMTNLNGMWSINSASETLIEDCVDVIEANSNRLDMLVPISAPVLYNSNANISSTSGGSNVAPGTGMIIRRPTVTIQGPVASSPNRFMPFLYLSSTHDVLVEGTISKTLSAAANPSERGVITGPWQPTGDIVNSYFGPYINVNAMRVKIQGIWIKSAAYGGGVAQPVSSASVASYGTLSSPTTTALDTSYTGPINIANPTGFDGAGKVRIASEWMDYVLGTRTTTLETNINSSYTGNVTVGSSAMLLASGTITIGTENITYSVVDATTINLIARARNATVAASHSISDVITGTTLTVHITARGVNSTTPATAATQTTTLETNINSTQLGNVTVGSTTGLGSYIKIGNEIIACSIVNGTTLNLTARAQLTSVGASHSISDVISNTATVVYLDTPIIQNNVGEYFAATALRAVVSGNITNATKLAL